MVMVIISILVVNLLMDSVGSDRLKKMKFIVIFGSMVWFRVLLNRFMWCRVSSMFSGVLFSVRVKVVIKVWCMKENFRNGVMVSVCNVESMFMFGFLGWWYGVCGDVYVNVYVYGYVCVIRLVFLFCLFCRCWYVY